MFSLDNIKWSLIQGSDDVNAIYSVIVQYDEFLNWKAEQKIDGFRPGKVPLTENIQQKFLNSIVNFIFPKIKTDNLFSVNYVLKTFNQDTPIEFTMTVESMPVIHEIDCQNYQVDKYSMKIIQEDINNSIKGYALLEANSDTKSSNEAAKKGDFLKLEIEDLNTNQKTFKDIQLGKFSLNPEIEKELENKMIDFNFQYKIGDFMNFNIRILDIKKAVPLNTKQIAEKLKISEDEIENTFRNDLEEMGQQLSKKLLNDALFKIIIESKFEIPLSLINKEFKEIYSQTLYDLKYNENMKLEHLIKARFNMSLDEFEKNLQNSAVFAAKLKFYFDYYAFKNKMEVSEEEIFNLIKARSSFFKDGFKEAQKFFTEKENERKNLIDQYLHPQIIDQLTQKLHTKEIFNLPFEELQKINIQDIKYELLSSEDENIKHELLNSKDENIKHELLNSKDENIKHELLNSKDEIK